jgi:hypothetical protein
MELAGSGRHKAVGGRHWGIGLAAEHVALLGSSLKQDSHGSGLSAIMFSRMQPLRYDLGDFFLPLAILVESNSEHLSECALRERIAHRDVKNEGTSGDVHENKG